MEQSRFFPSIDRDRRLAITAATFGIALFVVLALLLHDRSGAGPDGWIARRVVAHRPVLLVDAAKIVTKAGSLPVLAVLAAIVLIVGLMMNGDPVRAIAPAVALGVSSMVAEIAKRIVGRERPPIDWHLVTAPGHSFPSGHATNAAAFFLTWALVGAVTRRPGRLRVSALLGAAGVAMGLVGASRVVLGVHWPTDVLAGWILGAEVAGAIAVVMVRLGTPKGSKPVGE